MRSQWKPPLQMIWVRIHWIFNGKIVYALNDKMLMNPASVQKLLTTPVAYQALGEDYLFTTGIYSRNEGCYLIKLGADPYLKASDLKTLIKNIGPEPQRIFVV